MVTSILVLEPNTTGRAYLDTTGLRILDVLHPFWLDPRRSEIGPLMLLTVPYFLATHTSGLAACTVRKRIEGGSVVKVLRRNEATAIPVGAVNSYYWCCGVIVRAKRNGRMTR
jgi:hypothetical protein